jgi:hypothetical protein
MRIAIDHEALEEVEARHREKSHRKATREGVNRWRQNAKETQVRHSQEVPAAEPALFRVRGKEQQPMLRPEVSL